MFCVFYSFFLFFLRRIVNFLKFCPPNYQVSDYLSHLTPIIFHFYSCIHNHTHTKIHISSIMKKKVVQELFAENVSVYLSLIMKYNYRYNK